MARKSILCALLMLSASLMPGNGAKACTNIIVTRGASKDNSCIVSYAADSHVLYGELYYHPAADWKPGALLNITEWDTARPMGSIAQVPHTYKTVGNMNEHQLIIAETTWGGREELLDTTAVMDYGSLIYVTLQRARTAREAIKVIVDLVNEYGYASEGESFSIADRDEAWVMDLIGKGVDLRDGKNLRKGMVWVARRVPDGYICSHANQARITTFPLDDPENCLYAPDVISFAREMGFYEGADEDFDFSAAYCPYDFGTVRACDARTWSAFNTLCDGVFTYEKDGVTVTEKASDYYDYITGENLAHRMPLFVRPARKLGVKDVADMMRDHFEGTPLDMTTDIGAGGNALPYRWRPMGFSYNGWNYINERAIATQQTGFWFVAQARHDLPDMIGGLMWFGTDDAATSYLTPIYSNTDAVPECFREGNGSMLEYSSTASFWINNRVTNHCYRPTTPWLRQSAKPSTSSRIHRSTRKSRRWTQPLSRLTTASFRRLRRKPRLQRTSSPLSERCSPTIPSALPRHSSMPGWLSSSCLWSSSLTAMSRLRMPTATSSTASIRRGCLPVWCSRATPTNGRKPWSGITVMSSVKDKPDGFC